MHEIGSKFFAAIKAIALGISTFITKFGISRAMKYFPALSTYTFWVFTVWHISLLYENVTCKIKRASITGLDLSAGNYSAQALNIIT